MSIIFCPFDGTSKIIGTHLGAELIFKKHLLKYSRTECAKYWYLKIKTLNSSIYYNYVKKFAESHKIKLAIGGEHLITLPLLEVLIKKYPNLKLIVFDAHHDAYSYELSTNYSVMYYIIKELKIPVIFLGLRYEPEKAFKKLNYVDSNLINNTKPGDIIKLIGNFICNDPFYITFDSDVLDPDEFCAVSSPVRDGLEIKKTCSLLDSLLKLSPVACDFVEYNPTKDTKEFGEFKKIKPLLHLMFKWVFHATNMQ